MSQPHDDQNPQLSPEDIQLALERMTAVWDSGQLQAAFSPARIAEMASSIRVATSAERMADLTQRMQEAFSPQRMAELTQRMQEGFSPQRMAELTQRIQEGFSPERMRAIAEAMERNLDAASSARIAPAVADWQEAVMQGDAASQPAERERRSIASWLFWLPIPYQLAILQAGLACVIELTKVLEEAGNTDVPDELQAATGMMMAVMIFIVVVIQARTRPPDE